MQIEDILPNIKTGGLSTSGFLFGAGTSVEAGYPMMASLTRQVVGALETSERDALDEVLSYANLVYNPSKGSPNVEVIADQVISHAISTQDQRFYGLELKIRDLITQIILGVESPKLDNHVSFLTSLKNRAYGRAACVYIFTTNYDLLFEFAGAEAGVVVETGFIGSVERYFDPQRFKLSCGIRSQASFAEHATLTVRLIKLHGSVSWISRNDRIFERHPKAIDAADRRVMILPRRRKVMDTLYPPHDALFTTARAALGGECKYLVSCGFSFGDDHINDHLLYPAVSTGRIRLFALCEQETEGMKHLQSAGAFNAGFNDSGYAKGTPHSQGTDCWMFGNFTKLF